MLPSGTTEADHQVGKTTFDIIFHGNVHQVEYIIEKIRHFGLLFQKIFHFFITTGEAFKFFYSSGIKNTAAIKNKSTTIFTLITGMYFFIRKAIDPHHQRCLGSSLYRLKALNNLVLNN